MAAMAQRLQAQQPQAEALVARAGWVRLEVVRGRIVALPTGSHANQNTTCSNPQTGASESLSVTVSAGKPTLRYQFSHASQQLNVDIVSGDTVSIHRESRGDPAVVPLHFTQGPRELSLEVGEGADRLHATGKSLWHLLIAHGDVSREHLVPLLESLRPGWMLADAAERAQVVLVRTVDSDLPAKRERCRELVAKLASPDFQERRAAYQELRTLGHAALALLGDLDDYDLDAEQRLRLRALSGSLDMPRGDTADAIAANLIDDASVWISLLEHADPAVRRTAAGQLERIRGASLDFDPDADEATRRRQFEQLKQRG
jgi:hypothetical protein